MPVLTAIGQVTQQINGLLPSCIPVVLAIEQAVHGLPGETKLQLAVNAIIAGSQQAEGVPVPSVQAVAALVNLTVSLLNAFGVFSHGAKPAIPVIALPAPAAPAAA